MKFLEGDLALWKRRNLEAMAKGEQQRGCER